MRAVICRSYGSPEGLRVEELPDPEPRPREIVIRAEACGVNFADTLAIAGKYQIKSELPFVPGGEVAGTVIKVGADSQGFKGGDRIVAATDRGAFAEQVRIDTRRAMPIPESVDAPTAAAFFSNYGTAPHALADRGTLQAGETVLVLGASGGVGIAGIEIAKALGATVIAAASTQAKLDICAAHGADFLVNYAIEDLSSRVREVTNNRGADIVYDPVGGSQTLPALKAIAWLGRLLVIGFASGEIPHVPLNIPLLKGCSMIGLTRTPMLLRDPDYRARHFSRLTALLLSGALHPRIARTFLLQDAGLALGELIARAGSGKLIILP
jgi:NADPH2:quinone reductase